MYCRLPLARISRRYLTILGTLGFVFAAMMVYTHVDEERYMTFQEKYLEIFRFVPSPRPYPPEGALDKSQTCIHPKLDVTDPVMMHFYKKLKKVQCKGVTNWVFVSNGTLRFDPKAVILYGSFKCNYFPLIRGPGDYNITYGNMTENVQDGSALVSDFFKIECMSTKKKNYTNIHAGVHVNKTIKARLASNKPPAGGLGLSVALLGFDSMSRMSWLRRMPITRNYLVNSLNAIELEGYNILGDGTPAALLPILTGKHEQELPEARRSMNFSNPVDDFPWIWKDFQNNGYVTSWADAEVSIAPFNYRLLGFEHSPTDYFMRPFFLAVDPTYKKYSRYCHGSEPKHMIWLKWVQDLFYMYKDDPKFLVHFYTPLSHDDNNLITMADEDLKRTIENLELQGYLNNTLLLVMADHGARFANVRRTYSGKLEERMPYVSLRFPPWFHEMYPDVINNVKTNTQRLTNPFDIHETLRDILNFSGAGQGSVKDRGISLFKSIPKERSCEDADVAPHWCACLSWQDVNATDEVASRALRTAVETINFFTDSYRADCALLAAGEVSMVSRQVVNEDLLRFKETTGDRGLEPILANKSMTLERVIYQLTFFTEPGHGEFEVTLEYLPSTDVMTVDPKAISRINKYGDDPACILQKNREIRQFCYCNNNIR
nr:CAunnamed protein product [Biomphalaria glabrata]